MKSLSLRSAFYTFFSGSRLTLPLSFIYPGDNTEGIEGHVPLTRNSSAPLTFMCPAVGCFRYRI